VTGAETPPNVTEEAPWVARKPAPVIVTLVPLDPQYGASESTRATGVKYTPFEHTPLAHTPTYPAVALVGTTKVTDVFDHELVVTLAPPIVSCPALAPKSVPVTVTVVPTAPYDVLSAVIEGVLPGVKNTPLEHNPFCHTPT